MERLETGDQMIAEFLGAITPDLYAVSDLIDRAAIDRQLAAWSPAIEALQDLSDSIEITPDSLAEILREQPTALNVIKRLLAVGERLVFSDGRELPDRVPGETAALLALAKLLLELDLRSLFLPTTNVRQMVVPALIASEAPRRRFRGRKKLELRIDGAITSAVNAANAAGLNMKVVRGSATRLESIALRSVDYVIFSGAVPRGAITSTFQTRSGGRQQRDLTLVYPALQERLHSEGIELILLADGAGIGEMPAHVLAELFHRVFACMTLRQAEGSALAEALQYLAAPRGEKTFSLSRLIASFLDAGAAAIAANLPGPVDQARLALATYASEHPGAALELARDASTLQWRRLAAVQTAVQLLDNFSSERAIDLLASLISAEQRVNVNGGIVLTLIRDVFMSRRVFVAAASHVTVADIQLTALRALAETPEARFALCVVLEISASEIDSIRRLQYQLAINVIVLDAATLLSMAKSEVDPRTSLLRLIVAASDLAKVSPYVLSSVAPAGMYYGREIEEATVTATIHANSVALLGGRRIGKTSLMKHVTASISTAGLAPYFGDCQTVRTWLDFVRMAERTWDVSLQEAFTPDHLFELVDVLTKRSGKRIVLLLDEVDQLLDWDEQHRATSVPEAFFRACRGISQEGKAQFVFSGERIIAAKLSDAHSPHWNFCRPLPLRQLDRDAAGRLIEEPLKELDVTVYDREQFHEVAWSRTSGHPQLLQFIGDKLVHLLNAHPPDQRSTVYSVDLLAVTDAYEYVEQYLETYWGQATRIERLVSLFVLSDSRAPAAISQLMRASGVNIGSEDVIAALRLLDLYGIVERDPAGYRLRASWFPSALEAYGGADALMKTLRKEVA